MAETREIWIGDRAFHIHTLGGSDAYASSLGPRFGDDLLRTVSSQLTGESVALDIGANIGLTACLLSQVARQVYAFEPNPPVFDILRTNVETNGLQNVVVRQMAIGASAGEAFFAGDSAFGHVATNETSVVVPMGTVDGIVEELNLDRVDFIKIDVEGFEPQVLKGALNTIDRFNPVIYLEFNSWCLMAFGETNPMLFARWLCYHFQQRTMVAKGDGVDKPITNAESIVYSNVVVSNSVNDLILRRKPVELSA